MPRFRSPPAYQHGSARKTGVLLTNLGSPDAPEAPAVRRYLKQFLSDPRVVEIPRPLWWLILNGIILNVRPKKSAAKYQSIWLPEGSPLKVHTERQVKYLRGFLHQRGVEGVEVAGAQRYANPPIASALDELVAKGCDRILVLPLYPQYAASTTASTYDAVAAWGAGARNLPGFNFVRNFHDHPGYIAALAASVREHWEKEQGPPDVLLMSFHGLPRRSLELGDPYHCECLKTGRLLAEQLGLEEGKYRITFQSRFGKAEWLQPYTAPTRAELGRAGTGRVDVICPGFVSDCLETLEEIAIEGRDEFLAAGGKKFTYIPCLNERDDWLHALTDLVQSHLQGMLHAKESVSELVAARAAALERGAKQ
ncbi:MAG TPA: ferrochelatase [Burkholderiales bacterium]|nr:ferrochelatase [Burkholderiales bacterium]